LLSSNLLSLSSRLNPSSTSSITLFRIARPSCNGGHPIVRFTSSYASVRTVALRSALISAWVGGFDCEEEPCAEDDSRGAHGEECGDLCAGGDPACGEDNWAGR
jgi:hypothetical protein